MCRSHHPKMLVLFTELDARLPTGYYRGPSLVTTGKGTLLAFVLGAIHEACGVYVRVTRGMR